MPIRLLPEGTVNRIAAGEVVERPASVVKELVENALDAGARSVDVVMTLGGRGLIAVADDGAGMSRGELELAILRHATSKLPDDDLLRIAHLGFRGEALPSIGSVARLRIASRPRGADSGWAIEVAGGEAGAPEPAAQPFGSRVEVRDLFYATPARLKFLKSERAEYAAAVDCVERLAMARPDVAFSFGDGQRRGLNLPAAPGDLFEARLARLSGVLGRDFAQNAAPIEAEREGARLSGYAGLPTFNRANAQAQHLFVNGRPVRDRQLLGAVRAAYMDVLPHDRHAAVALFLELDPLEVDVNVHPAKAEVRFRQPATVRGLVIGAIRHALAQAGVRASGALSTAALGAARPAGAAPQGGFRWMPPSRPSAGLMEEAAAFQSPFAAPPPAQADGPEGPLGRARGQLHETYIVAQTADGVVLVDQHAAHERIVMEQMKAALAGGGVRRQMLLVPEVVELGEAAAARVLERAGELAELGLVVEPFGPGAVVVRETPGPLGQADVQGLLRDLADEIGEAGEATGLKSRLDHVFATMACHASVRAGRALSLPEMDALLREMERTPNAGVCNHGRPTFVELKLADVERLFGRR